MFYFKRPISNRTADQANCTGKVLSGNGIINISSGCFMSYIIYNTWHTSYFRTTRHVYVLHRLENEFYPVNNNISSERCDSNRDI